MEKDFNEKLDGVISTIRNYVKLFKQQEQGNKLSDFALSAFEQVIEQELVKLNQLKED